MFPQKEIFDNLMSQPEPHTMTQSLCEQCTWMRPVVTPKGSRFLLCQLSTTNADYPKYPPQPVVRCAGFQQKVAGNLGSSRTTD